MRAASCPPSRNRLTWSGVLFSGLLLLALSAPAGSTELPAAVNLRQEAAQASRHGAPLLIIFSRRDCKYCEIVKRDYLLPLTQNPRYRERVVVRQITQDSDAALTDFRGQPLSQAQFASAEKIGFVPVVAFYGPNGQRLAEPIVGARLADFYQGYLEEALETAKQTLAAQARRQP